MEFLSDLKKAYDTIGEEVSKSFDSSQTGEQDDAVGGEAVLEDTDNINKIAVCIHLHVHTCRSSYVWFWLFFARLIPTAPTPPSMAGPVRMGEGGEGTGVKGGGTGAAPIHHNLQVEAVGLS